MNNRLIIFLLIIHRNLTTFWLTYFYGAKFKVLRSCFLAVCIGVPISCSQPSKRVTAVESGKVLVAGAMRNVMMKGQLEATVAMDTLSGSPFLYGIGPEEFLKGEILIQEGKVYHSYVNDDFNQVVEENATVKAPFFVYAQVKSWQSIKLPDSITSLLKLERYLTASTNGVNEPFAFLLNGIIEEANIHIVNLPVGTEIKSPEDSHQGQRDYIIQKSQASMVGFYSRKHQGVFTHHDSYLHIHFIDSAKINMGHLDDMIFKADKVELKLPSALILK